MPDDRNAGTIIYNDIMIAGNTRQWLVPPWDDLPMEPMRILIDGNLDGVFDDSGVYIYRLQAGGSDFQVLQNREGSIIWFVLFAPVLCNTHC